MPVAIEHLTIVHYPHPVLRQTAQPVAEVNDEVRAVAMRMLELMRQAPGIGLAAPQVALPWRMFILDIPEFPGDEDEDPRTPDADPASATRGPMTFINPTLSKPEGPLCTYEEGCLSLPDIRGDVLRPEIITVAATDLKGQRFTLRAAGLLARCIQHEFDHLQGTLILDRMTQGARLKIRTKVKALEAGQ